MVLEPDGSMNLAADLIDYCHIADQLAQSVRVTHPHEIVLCTLVVSIPSLQRDHHMVPQAPSLAHPPRRF